MSDFRGVTVRAVLGIAAALVPCLMLALPVVAQQYDASFYSGLRWRMIGPFRGGRVNAVSGVPGQPNTFYFGSVGGGVWKSTNSGRTWTPSHDHRHRRLFHDDLGTAIALRHLLLRRTADLRLHVGA